MKNSLILGAIAVVFASSGFMLAPNTADAACSANGFFHSGGKCEKSFKHIEKKSEKKFHFSGGMSEESLRAYIDRLLAILAMYDNDDNNDDEDERIDVQTLSATNIDEDGATLRAKVWMNDEDEGELYFQYGTSMGNLSKTTGTDALDSSDEGDTLEMNVSGLSDGTRYYFRAVTEDADGHKDYGVTYNFMTDDDGSGSNNNDDPIVTTQSAIDIGTTTALLRGTVDMNDFDNGTAFFVYGEDEDAIHDVEDDFDSYADIDEDGDDLRKVLVDSDVDGTENMSKEVSGLDENTDIFFSLCVAYEDENDDDTLQCGSVREFETN